jgi:hypothetical protein
MAAVRTRLAEPYWLPMWVFGLMWGWSLFLPYDGWSWPAAGGACLGWNGCRILHRRVQRNPR